MLRKSAPRNRYTDWSVSPTTRDVVVAAGEEQDDLVLGLVGVLVLVDEDVLEALAVVLEHVGVVAQQAHRVDEQVVEVHRPGLEQAGLVLGVDLGVLAVEDVLAPGGGLVGVDAARSSTG